MNIIELNTNITNKRQKEPTGIRKTDTYWCTPQRASKQGIDGELQSIFKLKDTNSKSKNSKGS